MPQNKNRLFDRRVVDRYREKGAFSKEEYEQYLKALPDDSGNAQWVQMDIHDAELSEGASGHGEDT
jgi:hypothetical protein